MKKTKEDSSFKLSWLPNNTFDLEITIPWNLVKEKYNEILKEAAKQTSVKGFRKGKAPLEQAEKQLDKQKIFEETIKKLIPTAYQEAVKKHNLRPVMNPKIVPLKLKEGSDWLFKATSCEFPEVRLADYLNAVRGLNAKTKLWTPKDGDPSFKPKDNKQTYDQKINAIFNSLIQTCSVDLPEVLVEDEVNRQLTRLLDDIKSLNMTLEQYLASKNTDVNQLRQSYKTLAERTLKLELILQKIIREQKITASDQDINQMIASIKDDKTREALMSTGQKTYIGAIIAKRKVVDFLVSL